MRLTGALFQLDKLRVDLEWAKHVVNYCDQKIPQLKQGWSRFDKEYSTRRPFLPIFTLVFVVTCLCTHFLWYHVYDMGRIVQDNFAVHDYGRGWQGKFLQMFTTFFHTSVSHLLVNMVVIFCIGSCFERIHGSMITGLTMILSGIGGNMTCTFFHSGGNVGARGAGYGLFGAIYADMWTNWDLVVADYEHNPGDMDFFVNNVTNIARRRLAIFYCLMVEFSLVEVYYPLKNYEETLAIAHSGHFGGLFFGFCLALSLLKYSRGYDHLVSNDNIRTQRLVSSSTTCCLFWWTFLFLGMGFRIWSFDGSPPVQYVIAASSRGV